MRFIILPLFFLVTGIADSKGEGFEDLLSRLAPEEGTRMKDRMEEVDEALMVGDGKLAAERMWEAAKKEQEKFALLPPLVGMVEEDSDPRVLGEPVDFKSAWNLAFDRHFWSDDRVKAATVCEMVGVILEEGGEGLMFTSYNLGHLGKLIAEECGAEKAGRNVGKAIPLLMDACLEMEGKAKKVAMCASLAWITDQALDWPPHTFSGAYGLAKKRADGWVSDAIMAGAVAGMGGHVSYYSPYGVLDEVRAADEEAILGILTDEEMPVALRAVVGVTLVSVGDQLVNRPRILKATLDLYEEAERELGWVRVGFDRRKLHKAMAESLVTNEAARIGYEAVVRWEEGVGTGSAYFPATELDSEDLPYLLWICAAAGEFEKGREIAARRIKDWHKRSSALVLAMVELGDEEAAKRLLPEEGEPFRIQYTTRLRPGVVEKLDRFYEGLGSVAMQCRLEAEMVRFFRDGMGESAPEEGELLDRAMGVVEGLGKSKEQMEPIDGMRALAGLFCYPDLHVEGVTAAEAAGLIPEESLLKLYKRYTPHGFLEGSQNLYFAVRFAAAYAEGDLEAAEELVDEVLALTETGFRNQINLHFQYMMRLVANHVRSDLEEGDKENLSKCAAFWQRCTMKVLGESRVSYWAVEQGVYCNALLCGAKGGMKWEEKGSDYAQKELKRVIKGDYSPHYLLFRGCRLSSYSWNEPRGGDVLRSGVLREHFAKPEMIMLDVGSVDMSAVPFLYQIPFKHVEVVELLKDKSVPWKTRAYFEQFMGWQNKMRSKRVAGLIAEAPESDDEVDAVLVGALELCLARAEAMDGDKEIATERWERVRALEYPALKKRLNVVEGMLSE